MFQESKDELALILYGADQTNNDLADENNYQNINLVFSLSTANWHLFEEIQKIQPGNNPADCMYLELIEPIKRCFFSSD
jgi:hypothetical protein